MPLLFIFRVSGADIPYNLQSRIDLLSHVIPARTESLGQDKVEQLPENNTMVEIADNPEMSGFTDSNQDHSDPFHGYLSQISVKSITAQRASYWNNELVTSMGFDIAPESKDVTGLYNHIPLAP